LAEPAASIPGDIDMPDIALTPGLCGWMIATTSFMGSLPNMASVKMAVEALLCRAETLGKCKHGLQDLCHGRGYKFDT
jgi:hypothetical protein